MSTTKKKTVVELTVYEALVAADGLACQLGTDVGGRVALLFDKIEDVIRLSTQKRPMVTVDTLTMVRFARSALRAERELRGKQSHDGPRWDLGEMVSDVIERLVEAYKPKPEPAKKPPAKKSPKKVAKKSTKTVRAGMCGTRTVAVKPAKKKVAAKPSNKKAAQAKSQEKKLAAAFKGGGDSGAAKKT